MRDAMDEGLIGSAASDGVAELADDGLVATDVEAQAGGRVEPTLDIRRLDHALGVVLTLSGELDLATAPVLQERLDNAIRASGTVVIDLSRLKFVDSSGLRMLVGAERQLRDWDGQLVLVRGPRAVQRLFELTGLDSRFEFYDSSGAALRTALVRRIESRRLPKPARDDQRPSSTTSEQ